MPVTPPPLRQPNHLGAEFGHYYRGMPKRRPGSGYAGQETSPISRSDLVAVLNPLEDSRWDAFIKKHQQSSVFHSTGWLEALHRTYGYHPVVLSTSSQGSLDNGLVFCEIDSWITGRRWVSLPFSDHCEPLTRQISDAYAFLSALAELLHRERLRYFETRPVQNI